MTTTTATTLDHTLRTHPGLIPLKDLARMLGLHYQTVYGMVRESRIPHLRLGSKVLFEGHRLAEWLDERRVG